MVLITKKNAKNLHLKLELLLRLSYYIREQPGWFQVMTYSRDLAIQGELCIYLIYYAWCRYVGIMEIWHSLCTKNGLRSAIGTWYIVTTVLFGEIIHISNLRQSTLNHVSMSIYVKTYSRNKHKFNPIQSQRRYVLSYYIVRSAQGLEGKRLQLNT